MGGSVAALTALGAPDIALLTLSELADQVRRTCRAGGLSVIVDADHGYGNALNVMRTVEELENAGAAALTIEDTLLPAAFGSSGAAELISLDEGLGKVRAAVAAAAMRASACSRARARRRSRGSTRRSCGSTPTSGPERTRCSYRD